MSDVFSESWGSYQKFWPFLTLLVFWFQIWLPGISFCSGLPDGDYKDPANCYGYISCSDGLTNYKDCPTGLRYNYTINQCDWPAHVPCDQGMLFTVKLTCSQLLKFDKFMYIAFENKWVVPRNHAIIINGNFRSKRKWGLLRTWNLVSNSSSPYMICLLTN